MPSEALLTKGHDTRPIRHGRESSEKKSCHSPKFVPSPSALTQLSSTLCSVLPDAPKSSEMEAREPFADAPLRERLSAAMEHRVK